MKRVSNHLMTAAALILVMVFMLTGCSAKDTGAGSGEAGNKETEAAPADAEKEADTEEVIEEEIPSLHVEGTHLADRKGNLVQLRGISTHGIGWFPQYVNQECIHWFKENFGINVLRIAMYTAENGGYCIDGDKEALKALVDKGVQICEEEGIYAIIDWHILRDGRPQANQPEAEKFFDEMSAKYADKTHVLYEICNEPNGDNATWPKIKEYAEDIIPIIRKNDPDAVIICGTPSWSKLCYAPEKFPLEDPNVMYTMHFYAASNKETNRKDMQRALDAGLPVFVTEFGIVESNGDEAPDTAEGDAWMALCDQYGVSYVMWNLSNKDESCAFIKPDVTKTSDFTLDDLSESALWYYHHLTGK